jgi:NAD(P)-dependent dehydrogenase (short-subunit alcohol dehydrogenase family)
LAARRGGFDVVHAFSPPDALAGTWAAGRASAITFLAPLRREQLADRRLRLALLERAIARSGAVIASSEDVRRSLERWLCVDARALEPDDAAFEAALNANLLTSVRLVRAAASVMREGRWGRIVLLASYVVKQPDPALALSNTARTGLWAWAKTAARDLAPDGITLNLACPGPHATQRAVELGLAGPMGDPADFGDVVAFLCSRQAGFVTASAVLVDGGAVRGLL